MSAALRDNAGSGPICREVNVCRDECLSKLGLSFVTLHIDGIETPDMRYEGLTYLLWYKWLNRYTKRMMRAKNQLIRSTRPFSLYQKVPFSCCTGRRA